MSDTGVGWDELIQMLAASPQYADPVAGGLGGSTVSQNLSILRTLEELTGTPILELLAGNYQEFVPRESDTGRIYGGDPMFRQAFANVSQGVDPLSILNDIRANPGNYGIPEGTDLGDDEWAERTFSILEDYARESAAADRYNRENAGTYQVGGKTYSGDPNLFDRRSQYELMGSPDADELIKQYAEKFMTDAKKSGRVAEPVSYQEWQKDRAMKADLTGMVPLNAGGANHPDRFIWQTPPPVQPSAADRDYLAYVAQTEKSGLDLGRNLGLNDPNSAAYKAYKAAYEKEFERAKSTSVASDAERKLVEQIMFLRGAIGR